MSINPAGLFREMASRSFTNAQQFAAEAQAVRDSYMAAAQPALDAIIYAAPDPTTAEVSELISSTGYEALQGAQFGRADAFEQLPEVARISAKYHPNVRTAQQFGAEVEYFNHLRSLEGGNSTMQLLQDLDEAICDITNTYNPGLQDKPNRWFKGVSERAIFSEHALRPTFAWHLPAFQSIAAQYGFESTEALKNFYVGQSAHYQNFLVEGKASELASLKGQFVSAKAQAQFNMGVSGAETATLMVKMRNVELLESLSALAETHPHGKHFTYVWERGLFAENAKNFTQSPLINPRTLAFEAEGPAAVLRETILKQAEEMWLTHCHPPTSGKYADITGKASFKTFLQQRVRELVPNEEIAAEVTKILSTHYELKRLGPENYNKAVSMMGRSIIEGAAAAAGSPLEAVVKSLGDSLGASAEDGARALKDLVEPLEKQHGKPPMSSSKIAEVLGKWQSECRALTVTKTHPIAVVSPKGTQTITAIEAKPGELPGGGIDEFMSRFKTPEKPALTWKFWSPEFWAKEAPFNRKAIAVTGATAALGGVVYGVQKYQQAGKQKAWAERLAEADRMAETAERAAR